MAYRMKMRGGRNIKIGRVVTKIVIVVLSLYVGGTILTEIGNVINGTSSPFYSGLTLIGYTVNGADCTGTGNLVCATTGTGILTVVGLVGIASVIMEFVEFSRIG
jgi:hypothetical protein